MFILARILLLIISQIIRALRLLWSSMYTGAPAALKMEMRRLSYLSSRMRESPKVRIQPESSMDISDSGESDDEYYDSYYAKRKSHHFIVSSSSSSSSSASDTETESAISDSDDDLQVDLLSDDHDEIGVKTIPTKQGSGLQDIKLQRDGAKSTRQKRRSFQPANLLKVGDCKWMPCKNATSRTINFYSVMCRRHFILFYGFFFFFFSTI